MSKKGAVLESTRITVKNTSSTVVGGRTHIHKFLCTDTYIYIYNVFTYLHAYLFAFVFVYLFS